MEWIHSPLSENLCAGIFFFRQLFLLPKTSDGIKKTERTTKNRWISSAVFMLAASLIRNHPSSWQKGNCGNPPKSHSVTQGPWRKKKQLKSGKTNAISWLVSPGRVFTEGVATQKKKKLGKKKNSQLRQSLQLFCLMTKVCCRRCATLTMNLALRQRQNKAKARPGYNPVFGPGMKANWFSNSGCGTGVQSQSTTSSRRLLF